MKCRNCGAEIADKALICYRCGTATAEAKYKPAAAQAGRRRSPLLLVVIVIAVAVALAIDTALHPASRTLHEYGWVVVAAALVLVFARAYLRRR